MKLTGTEKVFWDYTHEGIPCTERNYTKTRPVVETAPITERNYHVVPSPSNALRRKMMKFKRHEIGLANPLQIVNSIVAGAIGYKDGYTAHCHNKRIEALKAR